MHDDWLSVARKRLLAQPVAGCWLGMVVSAIEASGAGDGSLREHRPPHYLVGGWAPGADGLYPRLPEFAAIASPDGERALRELFVHLPDGVPVHLVDERVADAALLAEMVLVCDANLEPYQREALERFARGRRDAMRERIAREYTDREQGFARLRARLLGEGE